jgi:hypothetical protein
MVESVLGLLGPIVITPLVLVYIPEHAASSQSTTMSYVIAHLGHLDLYLRRITVLYHYYHSLVHLSAPDQCTSERGYLGSGAPVCVWNHTTEHIQIIFSLRHGSSGLIWLMQLKLGLSDCCQDSLADISDIRRHDISNI